MPISRSLSTAFLLTGFLALPQAPLWAQTAAETTGESADEPAAATDAEGWSKAPADPAEVIATVNGEEVTLGDLIALRAELPAQYQSIPDGVLYDGLVEQLSNQILLRQAAERAGIPERPAVRRGLAFQRTSYLAELYVRQRLNEQIDEKTVDAAYAERYLEGEKPQEIKARHILLEDEAKAKEIAALAKEDGADFEALAKEHSTGPSAPVGGDLGWFGEGQMVPEFQAAVFALEDGAVSDPVQTQFGWHVILREGSRERPAPPLAEVQAEIIGEITRDVTEAVIAALRDNAEVTVKEGRPGLDDLRNDALVTDE